jgi:hypothetical protein
LEAGFRGRKCGALPQFAVTGVPAWLSRSTSGEKEGARATCEGGCMPLALARDNPMAVMSASTLA